MPVTKYTYSISSDFPSGSVQTSKLDAEILASSIVTTLKGIDVSNDVIDIIFMSVLTVGEQTTLDGDTIGPAGGLIAAHDNAAFTILDDIVISAVSPGINNDASTGIVVGHRWIDTVLKKSFTCADSTIGAAVWYSGSGGAHALGAHDADTLANLNAKVSDATLDDASASRTPSAHDLDAHGAATLAELNAVVSDATLDDASASRPPSAHDLDAHGAATLAELNAVVSDATLDDASASRTPSAHDLDAHGAATLAELNAVVSDATLDDASASRTDAAAIHDDVAAEISAITEKVTPIGDDLLLIEDSAAANVKKRIKVSSLPSGGGSSGWSLVFGTAIAVRPSSSGMLVAPLGRHMVQELRDGQTDIVSYEHLVVPASFGSGDVICEVEWSSPNTSALDARLQVKFGRVTTTQDMTAETFGTELTQDEADSTTANQNNVSTFTFTAAQFGAIANQIFYPFITRAGTHGNDTLTDITRIVSVKVRQA